MIRLFSALTLLLAGAAAGPLARPAQAQSDPAAEAWNRGDHVTAEDLYARRLAADSNDVRALHRLALIMAWSERYDRSLTLFDRLITLNDDPDAAVDRARVMAWSGDHRGAVAALDQLLARAPDHLPALRARARFLGWAGEYPEALESYRRVLDHEAGDLEALRGTARLTTWSGELRAGEAAWRQLLEKHPGDVESLVGLSQVLRWQGRHSEARQVQRRAAAFSPTDPDLRTEMRWTRAALAPRFDPVFVLESDSDGNRIATSRLVLSWQAARWLGLRAETYHRSLAQRNVPAMDHASRGGDATITLTAMPGWNLDLSAGAGATRGDGSATATYRVAAFTPPRPVRFGVDYGRRRLDVTAQLAENGVLIEELGLSARAGSYRAWLFDARASTADFVGEERNRRLHGRLQLARALGSEWRVSANLTGFGFRDQLREGYFSPDFFALAELGAGWSRELGSWSLSLEGAPGMQRVGTDGATRAALRGSGRVAYGFAPGRQIGIAAGYASNGLQSFATGDADYRYRVLVVSGGWAF